MQSLIKRFIKWRAEKRYYRYFKRQKAKANRLYLITGKQYFVIPTDDGKLAVVNNESIKVINKSLKQ